MWGPEVYSGFVQEPDLKAGQVYKPPTNSDLAIVRLSPEYSYLFDCVTEDESFLPGTRVTGIRDSVAIPFYEETTTSSPCVFLFLHGAPNGDGDLTNPFGFSGCRT